MMGPRQNRDIVSTKCASNLARWVLPDQDWQRLAALRFDRFLKREGLESAAPPAEQHERSSDWKELRERLFGFLLGGVAAACVLVSLSFLLGVSRPSDSPSPASLCRVKAPTVQVGLPGQAQTTKSYVMVVRP